MVLLVGIFGLQSFNSDFFKMFFVVLILVLPSSVGKVNLNVSNPLFEYVNMLFNWVVLGFPRVGNWPVFRCLVVTRVFSWRGYGSITKMIVSPVVEIVLRRGHGTSFKGVPVVTCEFRRRG